MEKQGEETALMSDRKAVSMIKACIVKKREEEHERRPCCWCSGRMVANVGADDKRN